MPPRVPKQLSKALPKAAALPKKQPPTRPYPPPGRPAYFRTGLTVPRLLFHTAGIFLILHTVAQHGFTVKFTYGASMVPTMATIGDAVLISKSYRRGRGVEVGDLVNYENPFVLGMGVIKRVVGMPRDFVLRDTPGAGEGIMVQVPEGHCWVAGDNQSHSRDSRLYGPVPLALIRGKVVARIWPWRDRGWFPNTLTEPLDELD